MNMHVKRDIIDCRASFSGRMPPVPTVWLDEILIAIESAFDVTAKDVCGKSRSRNVSHARFAAMHLMDKYKGYSLNRIGIYFGRRHHTTVLHGLRRAERLFLTSPAFYERLTKAELALIGNIESKPLKWPPIEERTQ